MRRSSNNTSIHHLLFSIDTEWQNARTCLLNHTGCGKVMSNFLNTLSNGTLDLPLNSKSEESLDEVKNTIFLDFNVFNSLFELIFHLIFNHYFKFSVADWTLNCLVNQTNCGRLASSFLHYLSTGRLDLQLDGKFVCFLINKVRNHSWS